MKSHLVVIGSAVFLLGGAARAGADEPGGPPVHRYVDQATGATVSLYRPAATTALVEVANGPLSVRKTIAPGVSVTRILSGVEDLVVTVDRTGVAVTDRRLGLTAVGRDMEGLTQARSRLRSSAAVRDALELLDGLDPVAGSPITHTLLVSQTMLESALGLADTGRDLAAWIARPRAQVRAVPVAFAVGQDGQELSATDCWTQYATEAIAAWIEYEQCVDSREWWDAPGLLACLVIYDMRAIGAFSWWVSCVGFRG